MSIESKKAFLEAFMTAYIDKHCLDPSIFSIAELVDIRLTLAEESDRGCALMAAAYLDYELERLLQSFLVRNDNVFEKLFNGNSPLATFSSKIDLSYSLSLIDEKVFQDLHLLRKIRNEFAHVPGKLSFTNPQIKSRCDCLTQCRPVSQGPRNDFMGTTMVIIGIIHAVIINTEPLNAKSPQRDITRDEIVDEIKESLRYIKSKPIDQTS